jgi:short-subunit dehydrogenase
MDISKQAVLITGASDGLGRAMAIDLAEKGCNLVIIGRNKEKLLNVKEQIKKFNVICLEFVCDVSDPDAVKKTVDNAVSQLEHIDILINNAGIWAAGPVETYDVKKINQLFATNTLGTIYMTQAVIPYMKKQNRGQILNVMSIAGVECKDAYGIIYTATKHALSGFTDTLKEELSGTGIKVMGFYPGGMATNILKAAGIEMPNSEDLSMKTEDVAKIISFVLSLPKDVVMDHFEVRKFTSKV